MHELAGQLLQPRLPRDLGHQGLAGDGAAAEAEDLLFILVKCILGEQILFLNNIIDHKYFCWMTENTFRKNHLITQLNFIIFLFIISCDQRPPLILDLNLPSPRVNIKEKYEKKDSHVLPLRLDKARTSIA